MATRAKIKAKTQIKMQVKVTGEGAPLVLVPGGLTGWISWEPYVEHFSTNRKVIRVQLLNVQWGFEDKELPSNYSVKMESRALAETLGELKFEKPIDIVAWSYGALVTLDYALDHPDSLRTLTLIEPPAFWVLRATTGLDAEAQRNAATLQKLHGDITEGHLEQFALTVGLCPPNQPCGELPQWPLWLTYRRSLRNSPAVLEHKDDIGRLRAFKHPVLLVKGTGSAKFLHQIIDPLAAHFPDAKVVEMPAGHAPHIVSKERFLEQLAIFQGNAQ
jgi:pimeloyl-ACP methyl ester carboxylesterase